MGSQWNAFTKEAINKTLSWTYIYNKGKKKGQEILRNVTPNIFPDSNFPWFRMLVKSKCGWICEVTFWQMVCSNWISADSANTLLGGEDLNFFLTFHNSCRYPAIRVGFSQTYRTRNISWWIKCPKLGLQTIRPHPLYLVSSRFYWQETVDEDPATKPLQNSIFLT